MPRPQFSIRSTVETDWPAVRQLRVENAADNPVSYGASLETTIAMTEDDWRVRARRGEASDTASVAAIETTTGRWIGMMSAQGGEEARQLLLTGVYVSPEFRGRALGVADALLDQIIEWAHGRGDALHLWVHDEGVPARRFYERRGFTLTGRSRPVGFVDGVMLEMAQTPLPARSGQLDE